MTAQERYECYESTIEKLNEEYTKKLEDYKYIIDQQKEVIKQQKDLINKLLTDKIVVSPEISSKITLDNMHTCIAPQNATCNRECDGCCYNAQLC
ncbi:MAG: hypothetical protein J6W64_07235 [Bacilli bacterium]|nr:hypothetical protein [Bacilli bacterium]